MSKITSYIENLLNKNIIREVNSETDDLTFDIDDTENKHYVFCDTHFGIFETSLIEEIEVTKSEIHLNNHYLEMYSSIDPDDLKYIIIAEIISI